MALTGPHRLIAKRRDSPAVPRAAPPLALVSAGRATKGGNPIPFSNIPLELTRIFFAIRVDRHPKPVTAVAAEVPNISLRISSNLAFLYESLAVSKGSSVSCICQE